MEYREADALAKEIVAAFLESRTVSAEDAFTQAVRVLAVNYRLGVEEAGLLGILAGDDVVKVLGLCIDVPSLEAQASAEAVNGLEYAEPVIEEE
jgi:hypothetical protein